MINANASSSISVEGDAHADVVAKDNSSVTIKGHAMSNVVIDGCANVYVGKNIHGDVFIKDKSSRLEVGGKIKGKIIGYSENITYLNS